MSPYLLDRLHFQIVIAVLVPESLQWGSGGEALLLGSDHTIHVLVQRNTRFRSLWKSPKGQLRVKSTGL